MMQNGGLLSTLFSSLSQPTPSASIQGTGLRELSTEGPEFIYASWYAHRIFIRLASKVIFYILIHILILLLYPAQIFRNIKIIV